jgi:hypothetical protein
LNASGAVASGPATAAVARPIATKQPTQTSIFDVPIISVSLKTSTDSIDENQCANYWHRHEPLPDVPCPLRRVCAAPQVTTVARMVNELLLKFAKNK